MFSCWMTLLLVPLVSAGFGFDVANWLREPQKVCVKGLLRCEGRVQTDVVIELWEKDGLGIGILDTDDLLSTTQTNSSGHFELCGSDNEVLEIEPYVLIHHHCKATEGCVKLYRYPVPANAIGGTFDMKTSHLDKLYLNTEEKCQS